MKALISGSCRILRFLELRSCFNPYFLPLKVGEIYRLGWKRPFLLVEISGLHNFEGVPATETMKNMLPPKKVEHWKLSAGAISSMYPILSTYMIGWYWYQMIYTNIYVYSFGQCIIHGWYGDNASPTWTHALDKQTKTKHTIFEMNKWLVGGFNPFEKY